MRALLKSRLLIGVAGGLFALFVCSYFPIWDLWWFNEWEGLGRHVSLWKVISEVYFQRHDPAVTVSGDSSSMIVALMAFGAGAFLAYLGSIVLRD